MILQDKDWAEKLAPFLSSPEMEGLMARVDQAYQRGNVYPPRRQLFRALELTPYAAVKAVILGQDPYHGPGQADGLAFSVPMGVKIPPSLRNIFRELESDMAIRAPDHGCLEQWALNGVLLLNTVLTVEAGKANSHRRMGWEAFTDAVFAALNRREEPIAFLLWGGNARQKKALITGRQHLVLEAAHPSPLSAGQGFFGCRHFSQAARFLESRGSTLSWALPGCAEGV